MLAPLAARNALTLAASLALPLVATALATAAAITPLPLNAATTQPLPSNQLLIVTDSGEHLFSIEIADDPVERTRGLMFRESMPRDHGMLFDFGREGERSFWMRNTPLPLDIIYASEDGTVISIVQGIPFDETPLPSGGPARFVFEVNAGVADEIGLAPGGKLRHRRIKP